MKMFSLVSVALIALGALAYGGVSWGLGLRTSPSDREVTARVVKVISGAEIEVAIRDKVYPVRLLGIDVPTPSGTGLFAADWIFQWGYDLNVQTLLDKEVVLERDVSDRDAEGRLLRYVRIGDTLANVDIVHYGYAYVDVTPPDTRHQDLLFETLAEARRTSVGMWDPDSGCSDCAWLQKKALEAAGVIPKSS